MIPLSLSPMGIYSGMYSSRPNLKKMYKDAAATLKAHNSMYAQRVLDKASTDEEINQALSASKNVTDAISLVISNNGITGTHSEHVRMDFAYKIQRAVDQSHAVYNKIVQDTVSKHLGLSFDSLKQCIGSQNDTVISCPVSQFKDDKEFYVTAHHYGSNSFNGFMRVQVPHNSYKVSMYVAQDFVEVNADILEQKHFSNDRKESTDYMVYIPIDNIEPNEVAVFKLEKSEGSKDFPLRDSDTSLNVEGVTENGEVLFQYTNKAQDIAQRFGFNLGYYLAF